MELLDCGHDSVTVGDAVDDEEVVDVTGTTGVAAVVLAALVVLLPALS
jgi:hypothetical protein